MGVRGGCRRAFDNPLRRAHLVSRKAPGAPLTFLPRHRLASARLPRRPWATRRSSTRTRSRARYAQTPAARPQLLVVLSASRLLAVCALEGRRTSEPAILLRGARVAGEVSSRTQTTRPHALTPTLGRLKDYSEHHAVTYHFPDAYAGTNTKSPPPPCHCLRHSAHARSFAFSPRHSEQPHPQVPAVVA